MRKKTRILITIIVVSLIKVPSGAIKSYNQDFVVPPAE
jgi:hypothetical protein